MANNRAFHAEPLPLETIDDVVRFCIKTAGRKNDMTGIIVYAGSLRMIASVLRDLRALGNARHKNRGT